MGSISISGNSIQEKRNVIAQLQVAEHVCYCPNVKPKSKDHSFFSMFVYGVYCVVGEENLMEMFMNVKTIFGSNCFVNVKSLDVCVLGMSRQSLDVCVSGMSRQSLVECV